MTVLTSLLKLKYLVGNLISVNILTNQQADRSLIAKN